LYRGISDYKDGYQHRTTIVKEEKCDLVTSSYNILTRWRDYFSRLLNVHGIHVVRQRETHKAEQPLPELSTFQFEWAIKKLKSHKSQEFDLFSAKLIKEGVENLI
jgi:hypothetical protein